MNISKKIVTLIWVTIALSGGCTETDALGGQQIDRPSEALENFPHSSKSFDLSAFQNKLNKLLWDFVRVENITLPEGFNLTQTDDYLKQSLRPILVPDQDGSWTITDIRETTLSKLLKSRSKAPENLRQRSFLKELPRHSPKLHRRKANNEDYQTLAKLYARLERKHTAIYDVAETSVPIFKVNLDASPLLVSSEGQRILIYDRGGINVSSFLRLRNQIIGVYQMQEDGNISEYCKSFEIDAISYERSQLLNEWKKTTIIDDDILNEMVPDPFRLTYFNNIQLGMINKDIFWNEDYEGLSRDHIWQVLEVLAQLNPDAQFVLLFSHVNKTCSKATQGSRPKSKEPKVSYSDIHAHGVKIGQQIVRLIEKHHINFVNFSMGSKAFDPSGGKMHEFKELIGSPAIGLRHYWMFKTILESSKVQIFKSTFNNQQFSNEIEIFVELGFKGFDALTRNGLVLVSNTNRHLNIPQEGSILDSWANEWDPLRLSWVDLAYQGLIYTNFRPIVKSGNNREMKWWIPLEAPWPYCFFPFNPRSIPSSENAREALSSDSYDVTSFATPVVLSFFNWLRATGLLKHRQDVDKLFSEWEGFPVVVDIQKWKHYIGL